MITTNLKQPTRARWYDLNPAVACTISIFLLLLVGLIVGRMRSAPAVAPLPTPALASAPVIVIQREVVATAAPTLAPTVDPLRQEVEQLRARVAELEAQQAAVPPPQVVYVEAPAEQPVVMVEQAVPTPAPVEVPTVAPQQIILLDRQQWAIDAQRAER